MTANLLPPSPTNCSDADPEIFFSDDPQHITEAKALCVGCPAFQWCVTAGATEEYGVWAGELHSPLEETNPEHARVLAMVRDGETQSAIARQLDMPRSTVAWIIGRYRPDRIVELAAKQGERDAKRLAQARRAAPEATRIAAVDIAPGQSDGATLAEVLAERDASILTWRAAGYRASAIARELGMATSRVNAVINAAHGQSAAAA